MAPRCLPQTDTQVRGEPGGNPTIDAVGGRIEGAGVESLG